MSIPFGLGELHANGKQNLNGGTAFDIIIDPDQKRNKGDMNLAPNPDSKYIIYVYNGGSLSVDVEIFNEWEDVDGNQRWRSMTSKKTVNTTSQDHFLQEGLFIGKKLKIALTAGPNEDSDLYYQIRRL